jgi:fatty acid desaturase
VSNIKWIQSALFYAWFFIGTPVYLVHVGLTGLIRGTRKDRINILTEYVLLAGIGVGAYLLARRFDRFDVIIHAWAIPMIVAMIFANVRSWAEHALTKPGSPLTRTRTVTSNRAVSFLMCNLNYHLEHHLCPGIPWYNLPRMHALLREEFKEHGAIIYKSYWRFLFDALRYGVHGLAMPSM